MEFALGSTAACCAVLFTNPLDVVKTRLQLQGELMAAGKYVRTYSNLFHAAYATAKVDGIKGLQKGLVPAVWYQFVMNGLRLGTFDKIQSTGIITRSDGKFSPVGCVLAGGLAGAVGASVGSPLYLVKTHMQSLANEKIAVGFQHQHKGGFSKALWSIYSDHGIRGLWRGTTSAIPRAGVGSAAQLTTFSKCKDLVNDTKLFPHGSWQNILMAAMASGCVVVVFMSPFDVVATRLYNQGVDKAGRGLLYRGVPDCMWQMISKEGLTSFYKGWGALYLRLGPHSLLNLFFWDNLRVLYDKHKKSR